MELLTNILNGFVNTLQKVSLLKAGLNIKIGWMCNINKLFWDSIPVTSYHNRSRFIASVYINIYLWGILVNNYGTAAAVPLVFSC